MMEFSKEKTKYEVRFTSSMKKDMKKAEKRHYDLNLLQKLSENSQTGSLLMKNTATTNLKETGKIIGNVT